MPFNPQLPFLATLELPDVSKLTNDPILHNPYWPLVLTNIPGDCPKFEGKSGEDPQAHVMTYHLWCSSNSWVEIPSDSIFSSGLLLVLLQSGTLSYLVASFKTSTL